jgi:Amt family ammonium transporter
MVGKKCNQHNVAKFHGYDNCNHTLVVIGWFFVFWTFNWRIGNLCPACSSKVVQILQPGLLHQLFPFLLFALFQAKFAIITPALITGAFAERIRF